MAATEEWRLRQAGRVTAGPLVETKLHLPRRRPRLVDRPRLRDRLRDAEAVPLTLVSAPAGFGKTTLLSVWLADVSPPEPVEARGPARSRRIQPRKAILARGQGSPSAR